MLLEQVADEAEPVAVDAGGVDADEDVALLDQVRSPELVALGDADGEAGHVEVAVGELAGVLGRLAAEQRALGAHAAFVHPGDDLGDLLGDDLADHQVVEEEERDRPAGGDVVDAHCDEVDADGVEAAHAPGDLDLGAHAVGAGDEHRVLEARQAHGPAEPAEAAEDQRVLRAPEASLHELDGAVARLHVDAGLLVREPLLLCHRRSPSGYPPSLRPASARHPVRPDGFARARGVVPSGSALRRDEKGPVGGRLRGRAGARRLRRAAGGGHRHLRRGGLAALRPRLQVRPRGAAARAAGARDLRGLAGAAVRAHPRPGAHRPAGVQLRRAEQPSRGRLRHGQASPPARARRQAPLLLGTAGHHALRRTAPPWAARRAAPQPVPAGAPARGAARGRGERQGPRADPGRPLHRARRPRLQLLRRAARAWDPVRADARPLSLPHLSLALVRRLRTTTRARDGTSSERCNCSTCTTWNRCW